MLTCDLNGPILVKDLDARSNNTVFKTLCQFSLNYTGKKICYILSSSKTKITKKNLFNIILKKTMGISQNRVVIR